METTRKQGTVKNITRLIRILTHVGFWINAVFMVLLALILVLVLFFPDPFMKEPYSSFLDNESGTIRIGMLNYTDAITLSAVQKLAIGRLITLNGLSSCVVGTVFLWQLLCLLRKVEGGKPFDPDNAKRITSLGWIVIISSVIYRALAALIMTAVIDAAQLQSLSVNFSLDMNLIIVGILLFILAGIFRYGSYLQEEVDGTV